MLSRAWCEAVVQRGITYVDPVDSPETPVKKINMKSGALEETDLSAVNKAFGRKSVSYTHLRKGRPASFILWIHSPGGSG